MPQPEFPHLHLTFQGEHEPRFPQTRVANSEVVANRSNPQQHARKIRSQLTLLQHLDETTRRLRSEQGLPSIPADRSFLLRLPEGADVEQIVKTLGVELVAETDMGLMLVSTADLEFTKIEQVLNAFIAGIGNAVAGSSMLDIYEKPDDPRRLQNILTPQVLALWPLQDSVSYTFDVGIQTAQSTREVNWPRVRQRQNEPEAEFIKRRDQARAEAWMNADLEWQEKAEARVAEIQQFIAHYGGEILSGMMAHSGRQSDAGMVFPDHVQIRIRLKGEGFRDVILNFAHVFEVSVPPEIEAEAAAVTTEPDRDFRLAPPVSDAPRICVIDSGIQENHRWLAAAIDTAVSRCFLPESDPQDTADYVSPQGHGTRVAGAILYPSGIPSSGEVTPVAWLQNARVLTADNKLPNSLPPEKYLHEVVNHFHAAPHFTKIFNHSINSDVPCPLQRMTAWAAKIDQLSHEDEVLIIQSVGNQHRTGFGDQSNPGLCEHLRTGRTPPAHHLEPSMRVANPAQSLHALSVGSVSAKVFDNPHFSSFACFEHGPSGFTRAGYAPPWAVVKPEVVEIGGDYVYSKQDPRTVRPDREVSIELLNSTMHGAPAYSKDGAGTSFAAPKVTHIAAKLQALFPVTSPLLYRALIVQSARWPDWAEQEPDKDRVLRLIGYGVPSIERATHNAPHRVTLITPDAEMLPSKKLHLYTIPIPDELRNAALEASIRVDITLAYTALPRRTRARRTGYLETWLDWESNRQGEPRNVFLNRMQNGGHSAYPEFPWVIHKRNDWGEAQETSRNRGSVQKDWAVFESFNLPNEFSVAVRSHKGWNHLDGAGSARYCLVVSFEAIGVELPIYSMIESQIPIRTEIPT